MNINENEIKKSAEGKNQLLRNEIILEMEFALKFSINGFCHAKQVAKIWQKPIPTKSKQLYTSFCC